MGGKYLGKMSMKSHIEALIERLERVLVAMNADRPGAGRRPAATPGDICPGPARQSTLPAKPTLS